jgi:hypothetical protein
MGARLKVPTRSSITGQEIAAPAQSLASTAMELDRLVRHFTVNV